MPPVAVERFWCPRDGSYAVDEHGFLRDPAGPGYWRPASPDVLATEALRYYRCAVLLGEPGAGKSTVLTTPAQLAPTGTPVLRFDLGIYGSEDHLVRDVFEDAEILAWSDSDEQLCLVLDSLDEARSRIPAIAALLAHRLERLPLSRLSLRLACRTADWPTSLEQSLKDFFGDVTVVELLPLRRTDIPNVAAKWCSSPDLLAEAIDEAGAGPLAARPLTLQLLARAYDTSGTMPGAGADLYTAGVLALCEEQNAKRRDAGLIGASAPDAVMAVAGRLAAATVFSGSSALWTGPQAEALRDDVVLDALAGGTEPTPRGSIEVTREAVREVVRTGLFTGRGGQRLGWAHATFADFLAAHWVVSNGLSLEQAEPLFVAPSRRCWPQTRLAAAWTVTLAPDRFESLIDADPEAFLAGIELPTDELRARVVHALFANASSLTAPAWERRASSLRHPGMSEQIRERLRDTDRDRRRLAFDLAHEFADEHVVRDLAHIALDSALSSDDRAAAAIALAHLPDGQRTDVLRGMALDPGLREEDPDDELKGAALRASWPHAVTTEEAFTVVTPRQRRNFLGGYAMFLHRLANSLVQQDVPAGLRWLLSDLAAPSEDYYLGAVANRVLLLAVTGPRDAEVVDALAQLSLTRAKDLEGPLFTDFRHEDVDLWADPELRHAVTLAALERHPDDSTAGALCDMGSGSVGLVRPDDLKWLADLYPDTPEDVRGAVQTLFSAVFRADIPEHRDLVLSLDSTHPLYGDLVHSWVAPIRLDSPEAAEGRERWGKFGRQRRTTTQTDDLNDQIEQLLLRHERGEAIGFWRATQLLTVPPGGRYLDEEDADLSGMKRWPTLRGDVRARFVDAAEDYLRGPHCQPDEWLDKPGIRYHPADAGYRALVLLLRESPQRLSQLPTSVWWEWAPTLATWPTVGSESTAWQDKQALLALAGSDLRDVMRSAFLTRLRALVTVGRWLILSNEADYLWDDSVAETYLSLAGEASGDSIGELVSTLARHDLEALRGLLLEWLTDPTNGQRHRIAAQTLIDFDLERSWRALRVALDADLELAQEVIGRSERAHGFRGLDDVAPALRAELYLWLRGRFPPEADPVSDEAHFVGPREHIGTWRDRLLRGLVAEGSLAAVEALRTIVTALPDEAWLARAQAEAESTLSRRSWTPTPLAWLLRLAQDRRTVLVNDSRGLAAAVITGLAEIQRRLTGATPRSHLLWDTHSHRPKHEDEISDYLSHELEQILVERGVIVNREVQIRRARPSSIGERIDLLAEAAGRTSTTSRVSVPLEVKGAWNRDLRTAMEEQLVDRYMADLRTDAGVYVVIWPDLQYWAVTSDDMRRAAVSRLERVEVERELADQAEALSARGLEVRVVHLSIDYGRPSRVP